MWRSLPAASSSRASTLATIVACGGSSAGNGDTPDGSAPVDPNHPDGSKPDDPIATDAGPDAPIKTFPEPTIVPGAADRFLLIGTVISPDDAFEGQVLVEGDVITCVSPGVTCAARPGASGATVIDTQGVISPGLVDTHNHILFDIFDDDDWKPAKVYDNHDDWTKEPRYQAMLDVKQCLVNDSQGKPAWCANTPYGNTAGSLRCEIDKYGELKGLVGGATSIVGLPGLSSACFGSLARSIDVAQNGLGTDNVQTSALFPPSKSSADGVCANFTSGKTNSYLIHCGEGLDDNSKAEFGKLGTVSTEPECLYAPQTAVTHGIGISQEQFTMMGQKGMKLVWSPRSNDSLYQATTDIPMALDAGVLVAIGADWSMGGSQNLIDEMRFAKKWSDDHWAGRLKSKDVVLMATRNGAQVMGLDGVIGVLKEGAKADITVFGADRTAPYDGILASRAQDVRLVMVGGVALYGNKSIAAAGPAAPGCETIDVCGSPKFLCVATTGAAPKLDQTLATIKSTIDAALTASDQQTADDGWNFAPVAPLVSCK